MRNKQKVVSLVERGGKIRSQRVKVATQLTVQDILEANVLPGTILHTDGSGIYANTGLKHESVDHNKTYVRAGKNGRKVHTKDLQSASCCVHPVAESQRVRSRAFQAPILGQEGVAQVVYLRKSFWFSPDWRIIDLRTVRPILVPSNTDTVTSLACPPALPLYWQ